MDNKAKLAENLHLFSADNLLSDTPIMAQVLKLRNTLSRDSDGTIICYEDMYQRIQDESGSLPSLDLQMDIPAGQEGAYQRQLLHALEEINDQYDRVLRKVIKMKSRMLNAKNLMDIQRTQFSAYYHLAIPIAIQCALLPKDFKITAPHKKELANSEYSALMDGLDSSIVSLINELSILEAEIKLRKKGQAAIYALGKDQVNAMWDSIQSGGTLSLDEDHGSLVKRSLPDEEDEIPSFISKHTKEVRVAASASLVKWLDTECPYCGERQFSSPSGDTCANGHGGAEGVDRYQIKGVFTKRGDAKPIAPVLDGAGNEVVISEIIDHVERAKNDPDYQVVYSNPYPKWSDSHIEHLAKQGEPPLPEASGFKPVTGQRLILVEDVPEPVVTQPLSQESPLVEDIESIVNEVPALATQAPLTPRRKLLFDDEGL